MAAFCNIDVDKQTEATITLLPRGEAWDYVSDKNSNLYKFWKSIASVIVDLKQDFCNFYNEIYCSSHTDKTNQEWLKEYGLPNECDLHGLTLCLLANGVDDTQNLEDIILEALGRLGINATFVDEKINGIPLTFSVFLHGNSPALKDCLFTASDPFFKPEFCGTPALDCNVRPAECDNASDPNFNQFNALCGADPAQIAQNVLGYVASDPENECDNALKAIDPQQITSDICGFYASDPEQVCGTGLFAGKSLYELLPNLDCIFKNIVPLGFRIEFYFENYNNKIKV